jgi:hypothetical protein
VGYLQLHATNKSQVKGEIKAVTIEPAKRGRKYDNFSISYNLEPEIDIQSGDVECRVTGFLYFYTLAFRVVIKLSFLFLPCQIFICREGTIYYQKYW